MPSSRSTTVPPHEAFALVFDAGDEQGLRQARLIVGRKGTGKMTLRGQFGLEMPIGKVSSVMREVPTEWDFSTQDEAFEQALTSITLAEAAEPGPRARAILRGRQIAAEDLKAAGGAYTQEEVRLLRGDISRQAIHKAVQDKRMLTVGPERMARRFPVIQFRDDGELVEGLREVQTALDEENGYAVLNFLVRENGDLGGEKPIDVLARGEIARVVAVAESYGEHGQ